MDAQPIVSIKEARDLLGEVAVTMTDEDIVEVIRTLNILAKDALETAQHRLAVKRDARDLAQLIYDIYRDEKKK